MPKMETARVAYVTKQINTRNNDNDTWEFEQTLFFRVRVWPRETVAKYVHMQI